jgi:hypothetical protein
MHCSTCGKPLDHVRGGGTEMTCVGFFSPPGHDHDDNCLKRVYVCADGHRTVVSKRRRCPAPGCDWKGKETCFCHPNPKVDEWPEVVGEPCADEKPDSWVFGDPEPDRKET